MIIYVVLEIQLIDHHHMTAPWPVSSSSATFLSELNLISSPPCPVAPT
jgi:hypothetical protein